MLALVIALTGSAGEADWSFLTALTVVAIAAGVSERALPPSPARASGEMVMAALIIGIQYPASNLALPYLLLPGFSGGLSGGLRGAAAVTTVGAGGLTIGAFLNPDFHTESAGDTPISVGTALAALAIWTVVIFLTGVIGAWLQRQDDLQRADVARYAAAYRLLSELRVVSRRLSGGLDPVDLAEGILDGIGRELPVRRSALLVKREGGALFPLAHRGHDDGWLLGAENDPSIVDGWASEQPTLVAFGRRGYRAMVPMRVGSRTIGVVVTDLAEHIDQDELDEAAQSADEGAVRLETALLFDEVRELATREERQRLAREIHDGIAQELASLGYLVDDLLARTTDADAVSLAMTIRSELTRVLSDLRHSIFDLRSDVDRSAGLGATLSGYARSVGSHSGLKVHLIHEESHDRLRPEVEAELLRIAQEAITNVRKHAKARNLWVTISVNPPTAHIQVADDGQGIQGRPKDRYGLDIMSERARRVGAQLLINDAPAGGTVVDVTIGATNGEG
jgi:signal transduction histidine kinase